MFNAGLCYSELKQKDKAKEAFNTVISINPKYAYAYYALGMAYEEEKNYTQAIANYEKFVGLTDDAQMKSDVKKQIEYLKTRVNEK